MIYQGTIVRKLDPIYIGEDNIPLQEILFQSDEDTPNPTSFVAQFFGDKLVEQLNSFATGSKVKLGVVLNYVTGKSDTTGREWTNNRIKVYKLESL